MAEKESQNRMNRNSDAAFETVFKISMYVFQKKQAETFNYFSLSQGSLKF
jgi:hypothetical protein